MDTNTHEWNTPALRRARETICVYSCPFVVLSFEVIDKWSVASPRKAARRVHARPMRPICPIIGRMGRMGQIIRAIRGLTFYLLPFTSLFFDRIDSLSSNN
jgi:hypothetical protein